MPPFLMLNASGKGFELVVDPTGLAEGCHFAEVLAKDAKQGERGPVARVPISVIIPRKVVPATLKLKPETRNTKTEARKPKP